MPNVRVDRLRGAVELEGAMQPRRLRVLIAALLSLPLTVAMSWLPMLWAHRAAYRVSETKARWPENPPPAWPVTADGTNHLSKVFGARVEGSAHNLQMLAETRRKDPTVVVHSMSRWEYGVPLRSISRVGMSVQAGRTITPTALPVWRAGIRLPAWFHGGFAAREFLPIRPIWSGFLVNWLFFGLLVWSMIVGVRWLRMRRRTRRGLRIACTYSLGGLTMCPECGLARKVS